MSCSSRDCDMKLHVSLYSISQSNCMHPNFYTVAQCILVHKKGVDECKKTRFSVNQAELHADYRHLYFSVFWKKQRILIIHANSMQLEHQSIE